MYNDVQKNGPKEGESILTISSNPVAAVIYYAPVPKGVGIKR